MRRPVKAGWGSGRSGAGGGGSAAPHRELSAREHQVLQGLLAGDATGAIADRLQLSTKTVANYQSLIRRKLGVATAMELFRYAQKHQLF